MRRPRLCFASTDSGGDGAPPGVTRDPCEELADSGPLLRSARGSKARPPKRGRKFEPEAGPSGLQKARSGAEMRTPRWRAERRHAPATVRALKPRLRRSARRPPHIEGEKEGRPAPGLDKE